MQNFIDNYVLNRRTYKLLIMPILLVMLIPFVHVAYGGYVKYLLIFGILVAFWELIREKSITKLGDKVNVLLVAFTVFYLVSIVLNRQYSFGSNIKQLAYMAVFFWLLFMFHKGEKEEDVKKEITVVSTEYVIFSFIFGIVSIATYILGISKSYTLQLQGTIEKGEYFIGWDGERLWGLCHPNSSSVVSAISIILSLYLISKLKPKIFLIINILLQYVLILLNASRATFYALLFTVFVVSFIYLLKKTGKRIVPFVSAIVIFAALIELSAALQSDSSFLYSNSLSFFDSISLKILEATGRDDVSAISTNGRLEFWQLALQVFKDSPIFGLTREGFIIPLNDLFVSIHDWEEADIFAGGIHNGYITVLVSSGIVGFTLIAVAIGIIGYEFLYVFFKKKEMSNEIIFSMAVSLFFLITELVENRILYQVTLLNVLFWIYLGYMYFFVHKEYVAIRGKKDLVEA